MKQSLIIFCLSLLSMTGIAQYGHVDHWETAVYATDTWKYHVGLTAPDTMWKDSAFVDTAWTSGKGGIGYGYNNLTTTVPTTPSLYLRRTFTITDTSKIVAALISADWDDGFVVYFNGYEVSRENIGTAWVEPKNTDLATYPREAELETGGKYWDVLVRSNQLRYAIKNGVNVLAIQVHNVSLTSSDLAAFFNLHFGLSDASTQFSPLPAWVEVPPVFADSSKLPIVRLTSTRLNDSLTIPGTMEIVWNGADTTNSFYQAANHYDGNIMIKYRGNSTLQFPKKSFRIETVDSNQIPVDQSLLGMPSENDWVLYAPYSDKSLLRNYLSYHLARGMEEYAPRTQLVEVMHNGYYIGVYVFTEKIKRGDDRVNVNKLEPSDTNSRAITGGYMMRIDWDSDTNTNAFHLDHDKSYKQFGENTIQYYRPKFDSLVPQQKEYLKNYMWEFEEVMLSDTFNNPGTGYSQYADLNSFIDYMIMREFAKEIDGYRYSLYLYKNHEEDDNKIHMGPLWDFNFGYGNVDYSTAGAEDPEGWMYSAEIGRVFWFVRMLDDKLFANMMDCRYRNYRKTLLSDANIEKVIDDAVLEMGEAEYRNHYTWKTLGRYVWPNYFVGDTYEEEITYLKDWIEDRVNWMDIHMPGDCFVSVNEANVIDGVPSLKLMPNPARDLIVIQSPIGLQSIKVYNTNGVLIHEIKTGDDNFHENSIDLRYWDQGLYIISAVAVDNSIMTSRFLKTR